MSQVKTRRVVITGVGLVSPLGIGTEATWDALLRGESGIAEITRFDTTDYPCRIAGEVKGFEPSDFVDKKDVKKSDTFIHYAMAAAHFAMEDSGLVVDDGNRERVGVLIGSGIGGLPVIEATHETLLKRGPRRISPFFIPSLIVNMAAGMVSIRYGAQGPNTAPATACTTGLHAIGDAYRQILHGYADAMITGGTESVITPLGVGGFAAMKALTTRNDEPQKASRPWDRDRDGFVVGEGSGLVVLEEFEGARRRGARIYAEIVGYGMSADAYHISAPEPEGRGAAQVMRAALADAGLPGEAIQYINAHGTSTPLGDLAKKLAISSTKSSTGHLLGAAGGLETGILALAVHQGKIPATINLDHPDEEADLDFVPHVARDADLEYALTNSFGFGGTNGDLILRRMAD